MFEPKKKAAKQSQPDAVGAPAESGGAPAERGGGVQMKAPEHVKLFCPSSGKIYAQGNLNCFWIEQQDLAEALRHGFIRVE